MIMKSQITVITIPTSCNVKESTKLIYASLLNKINGGHKGRATQISNDHHATHKDLTNTSLSVFYLNSEDHSDLVGYHVPTHKISVTIKRVVEAKR